MNNNPDSKTLLRECDNLITSSRDLLSWQWDSRFNMALAQFNSEDTDRVQEILRGYFAYSWMSSDADQAPPAVQEVIGLLGGLMSGQILFTTDPEQVFLLGAWWPWNNGKKISIRVAFHGENLTDSQETELASFTQSLIL